MGRTGQRILTHHMIPTGLVYIYHYCLWNLIRGYWHCRYWHLIGSSQNVWAKANSLLCCESHVRITFSSSNLHDKLHHWNPWSWNAEARVVDNVARRCMTVGAGVGKWLHMLPSHPALGPPQGFSWAKKQTATLSVIVHQLILNRFAHSTV